MKPTSKWCDAKREILPNTERGYVRCKACGRRLMLQTVLHGEQAGDIEGYRIPPHKTKPRVVRHVKRTERRGRVVRR